MNGHRFLTELCTTPGRSGRVFVAALLALALTLALSRGASAAAGLTASENPVIIPYGSDTKQITLAWDLGGMAKAGVITVTDDVQAKVLGPQWVFTQTGSVPLTVTIGRTYTVKLVDGNTQATIGSPLTITTKRLTIQFDLGCLVQCITAASVEPHGTYAAFPITTNEKVYMTLAVSKATASGSDCVAGTVAGTQTTILPVTAWSPQIQGLEAGKLHRWSVLATDANGNKQSKSGCFWTLRRKVTVTFADIYVSDDSDSAGAGDIYFWFWVGGQCVDFRDYWSGIDSGDTVHPNVTHTVLGAPATLNVKVVGKDDDSGWGSAGLIEPWVVGCSTGPGSFEGDSATAEKSLTFPTGPEEIVNSQSFQMSANGDSLKFKVTGTFAVAYVP